MKSLFLMRYRMDGGRMSMLPVYARNIDEAQSKFDSRMGDNGVERLKYHVVSFRQLSENQIRLSIPQHREYVHFLTDDDRAEFFADRESRRLAYS